MKLNYRQVKCSQSSKEMNMKRYGEEITQAQEKPCKQSHCKTKTRLLEEAPVKTAFKEDAV